MLYKYGWHKQKNYKTNDVEAVVDSHGIFWLTEKHIEEVLDHKKV